MSDVVLDDISHKLDSLIKLIAYYLIKDMSQKEQITLLSNAGFKPKQIAKMIGTSSNTVSVTLSALRKKRIVHD